MKNQEVIIIDCQILQTGAFDRGMGRYVSSLLTALSENAQFKKKYKSVKLLLNSNLEDSESRVKYIQSLMPEAVVVKRDLSIDIDKGDIVSKENKSRDEISNLVNSLDSKNVTFMAMAPFFVGFVAMFPNQDFVKKISIVYDFIPYRIWHKQRIFPDELYFRHFHLFFEADHLLTISEFVKNDLIDVFKISSKKVESIDGGPFKQAKNKSDSRLLPFDKYIVYPSAPIIHKNNDNAVKGFNDFNSRHDQKYHLVFTSNFDEKTKERLKEISDKIHFSGNVSDSDLANIYENAEAVLFASLSEGLGMPVLEAMQYNKPIACSDIPVLMEISKDAVFSFKPNSPKSISDSLTRAVNKKYSGKKLGLYNSVLAKYTWKRSAEILVKTTSTKARKQKNKQTIAVCTPDTSINRKNNRLLEKMYAPLSEEYNLVIFSSSSKVRVPTKKNPSFTKYVNTNLHSEDISAVLRIASAEVPDTLKELPLIEIKQKKVLKRNKKYITFQARKSVVDEYLEFNDWEYKFEAGNELVKILNERVGLI